MDSKNGRLCDLLQERAVHGFQKKAGCDLLEEMPVHGVQELQVVTYLKKVRLWLT